MKLNSVLQTWDKEGNHWASLLFDRYHSLEISSTQAGSEKLKFLDEDDIMG